MLLTVSLCNKGSFLGSLINKCRPVATANLSLGASTSVAKTVEEIAGLPPRPKRPLSPYFRFMKEQRPKLQAAYPKLSILDIVKQTSKLWETADVSLKQRLQEEYKKDMQEYLDIRIKYDAKITDEQRCQIKKLKQEITEAREKRMMRKRIKQLGRPKRPASAFLKFLFKERTVSPRKTNETFKEWQQRAVAKWKTLTDEEKNVFVMEVRKELETYKNQLSLWEEQMIRLGNIDVIRHMNLIDPPEPKQKKQLQSRLDSRQKS